MDIELFYREKGSGEPLILLHGNGEDGSYFVHQIEHFQSRYRVIALDTRGHGRSTRGSAPFTIRQFALDLYDFLRAHEIPSAVLLGFSDGANIAMQFALDHPEMVRALILNGATLLHGRFAHPAHPAQLSPCSTLPVAHQSMRYHQFFHAVHAYPLQWCFVFASSHEVSSSVVSLCIKKGQKTLTRHSFVNSFLQRTTRPRFLPGFH